MSEKSVDALKKGIQAVREAMQAYSRYREALEKARVAMDEVASHFEKCTKQPHIEISDYEIDN